METHQIKESAEVFDKCKALRTKTNKQIDAGFLSYLHTLSHEKLQNNPTGTSGLIFHSMRSESKRAPETVLYGSYKFLGIHVTNNLSWNEHMDYVFKKANKRLYALRLQARSKLPAIDFNCPCKINPRVWITSLGRSTRVLE